MTRETKLGIGVAGAFLVAVGAWAGLKWHRGDSSATSTEEPAAAQAEATPSAGENKDAVVAATTPAATTPTATPAPQPLLSNPESPPIVVKSDPPPPDLGSSGGVTAATSNPPTTNTDPPPPNMAAPVATTPNPVTTNSAPTNPVETPPAASAPVAAPNLGSVTTPPADPTPANPAPVIAAPTIPATQPTETKKDDPPAAPPAAPANTTPESTPPPSQPSVTVVPAGISSAASLGPPGGGPTATTTGVTPVRPRSEPRVQSYLEEEYRWQPGDTFAAVSQKYYFTEKYGAALQQYNRDYPLAGAGMRQNPPVMAPGQAIWIPPVRILERDYANQIADFRPLNDRGSPIVPTNRTNAAAGSDPSGGALKLTKVRDRGETLYELGRRSLGDSGQWFKIYRLNPTLSNDPKLPIPAGTVLRLPAEATVEAGDMP
jgi:hypothetical protein